MKTLADGFNTQRQRTPDGQTMEIRLLELTPEEMVNRALAGETSFQAITPDSSLWLDQLNRRWAQNQPAQAEGGAARSRATLTGEPVRYAVSPIVIAAWEDVARGLGWPRPAGELEHAAEPGAERSELPLEPPEHRVRERPAGDTLAEFYAGAGVQRGLTAEMAQDTEDGRLRQRD